MSSSTLGSKALEITRENSGPATGVVFSAGDPGDLPCCGTYVFSFRAHGRIVPTYAISSATISVRSLTGRPAVALRLYDGAYHLIETDSVTRLSGNYDPGLAHYVVFGVDLTNRNYSVCINNELLASGKPLLDSAFDLRHSLQIDMPATYTESFPNVLVVDDVRIRK